MKAKTKRRFQQAILWFVLAVFTLTIPLIYGPIGNPAPEPTPAGPPLEQIPGAREQIPGAREQIPNPPATP